MAACSCLQEYFHPREVLLLVVGMLLSGSLLLASLCGVGDPEEAAIGELRRWAQRPWEEMECRVESTGISYLGDCDNQTSNSRRVIHRMPRYDFSDCRADLAPGCEATVRRTFVAGGGRRLGGGPGEAEPESESEPESVAAEGRQQQRRRESVVAERQQQPPRQLAHKNMLAEICRDRFSAWARVKFESGHSCGYRTGLLSESTVLSFKAARSRHAELAIGSKQPCWLLTLTSVGLFDAQACRVLALEDPRAWSRVSEDQLWLDGAFFWTAVVLAAMAVALAVLHHLCWQYGVENWGDFLAWRDGFLGLAPESQGQTESERVRFVRDRWSLFRASVLADYQLVGSARDCVAGPAPDCIAGPDGSHGRGPGRP